MLLEIFQVGTLSDLGLKFLTDSHIASRVRAALRMFIRNIRKCGSKHSILQKHLRENVNKKAPGGAFLLFVTTV